MRQQFLRGRKASPSAMLVITMTATFLAIMDQFIINVALPAVRHDLGSTAAGAEFAVSGYALVYGALLITGGRLGDLFGYRRLFLAGTGLFTAASLGCGIAPTAGWLVAFRVLQGAGSALYYPQILSFLQTGFSGRARGRAFAVFGAVVGLAAVCGQVLGGLLVSLDLYGLSWRPIFLINLPLGLFALVGGVRLPERRGVQRPQLDAAGVARLTGALLLLTVPLVGGPDWGWPWWAWLLLAGAVPALWAFARGQLRLAARGGEPLLDPELFRRGIFGPGTGLALVFFSGNAGLLFLATLHFQQDLGYSPLRSGATFASLTAAFGVASLIAPRLSPRLGLHLLTLGYGLNLFGTLWLLGVAVLDGTETSTVGALIVVGLGQGFGVSPLMGAVLESVPSRNAGAASGAVETTAQLGASLGTVLVGLVFQLSGSFAEALLVNVALSLTALLLMRPVLGRARAAEGISRIPMSRESMSKENVNRARY